MLWRRHDFGGSRRARRGSVALTPAGQVLRIGRLTMSEVRSLAKWKRVRRAAIERDGYRCRHCGRAAGRFEVDHIIPLSEGGAPYALDGLQTLCVPCHLYKSTVERGGIPHVPDAAWERLVGELLD